MDKTTISGIESPNEVAKNESSRRSLKPSKVLRFVGITGVTVASSMMIWFLAGLTELVPSMIDVFGIPGLRFPAGIAISGLLAASIGFNEF
jgi:hypothetical protein